MSDANTPLNPLLKLLGQVVDVVRFMSHPAPPVAWLIESLVPRSAVVALVGQSSSLKSWLCLFLAGCVASGSEFCPGIKCAQGAVWFFDYENGMYRLWRRVRLLWPEGLLVPEGALTFLTMPPLGLADPRFAEVFRALVDERGAPALVVFDTYRAATAGIDENDSSSREVIDSLKVLAEQYGTTFLVVHHTGKNAGSGLNAPRGSSAFANALDALIVMERPDEKVRASTFRLAKDRDGGREDSLVFTLDPGENPCARVAVIEAQTTEQLHSDIDTLVLAAVEKHPGSTQNELALLTARRKKDVGEALGRLVLTGKVHRPSRTAGYHLIEGEGVES